MTTINTRPAPGHVHQEEPRLYTVQEAANLLRVSPWTLHRLIRERSLDSIKVGARRLISATDLERYIADHRTGAFGGSHE